MTWMAVDPAANAAEVERRLLNRLADLHGTTAGAGVAVFRSAQPGAGPMLYLSATAAAGCEDLLRDCAAAPSGAPPLIGTVLLYGGMEAFDLLQPEAAGTASRWMSA